MLGRSVMRRNFSQKCKNYINGKWVEPTNQGVYKVYNPVSFCP